MKRRDRQGNRLSKDDGRIIYFIHSDFAAGGNSFCSRLSGGKFLTFKKYFLICSIKGHQEKL